MLEITNRTRGPVQLVIRSKRKVNSFTTKYLPGKGSGMNVIVLPEERVTESVYRAERAELVSIRTVTEEK